MNDLKARGVQDILLAIVDGLQGFPDAITAVFPDTIVQTGIVHLIREFDPPGGLEGPQALGSGSEAGLPGRRCRDGRTGAGRIRRRRVGTAFPDRGPELAAPLGPDHSVLRFPAAVRKIVYTTNAIESLHSGVRKSIRNKGHFPSDEAATKLIWLALRHLTAKWKNPPVAWAAARVQFAIQFGDRFRLGD